MTQKPPPPLAEPGIVLTDGTVLPGQEAVEAWQRAAYGHQKRVRQEMERYRAECGRLRELFGPPRGAVSGSGPAPAWQQLSFDDLDG